MIVFGFNNFGELWYLQIWVAGSRRVSAKKNCSCCFWFLVLIARLLFYCWFQVYPNFLALESCWVTDLMQGSWHRLNVLFFVFKSCILMWALVGTLLYRQLTSYINYNMRILLVVEVIMISLYGECQLVILSRSTDGVTDFHVFSHVNSLSREHLLFGPSYLTCGVTVFHLLPPPYGLYCSL